MSLDINRLIRDRLLKRNITFLGVACGNGSVSACPFSPVPSVASWQKKGHGQAITSQGEYFHKKFFCGALGAKKIFCALDSMAAMPTLPQKKRQGRELGKPCLISPFSFVRRELDWFFFTKVFNCQSYKRGS